MPRPASSASAAPKGALTHVVHGFDPLFDQRSRILVLGSFPSVKSRQNSFYYGNPQNRFWKVMSHVLQVPTPDDDDIAGKTEMLLSGGVALWDVVHSCDIVGSSDSSIRNVVPNDVPALLRECSIQHVFCNGGTSGRLYKRHLEAPTLMPATTLPSTSPANASFTLDRLVEVWERELTPFL